LEYKTDGLLRDSSKVPDSPILNLLIVSRDIRSWILGEFVVDTGFDAGVSANVNLVEFLGGSRVIRETPLRLLDMQWSAKFSEWNAISWTETPSQYSDLAGLKHSAQSIAQTHLKMSSWVEPS